MFIHKRCPTTNQRGSFCLLCFQPVPLHSSLSNLFGNDYSKPSILTSALVRTLDRHARSNGVLPAHAHPTRQAALVATLTEIRHDPLPRDAAAQVRLNPMLNFIHVIRTCNHHELALFEYALDCRPQLSNRFVSTNLNSSNLYFLLALNPRYCFVQNCSRLRAHVILIGKFTNSTNIICCLLHKYFG